MDLRERARGGSVALATGLGAENMILQEGGSAGQMGLAASSQYENLLKGDVAGRVAMQGIGQRQDMILDKGGRRCGMTLGSIIAGKQIGIGNDNLPSRAVVSDPVIGTALAGSSPAASSTR